MSSEGATSSMTGPFFALARVRTTDVGGVRISVDLENATATTSPVAANPQATRAWRGTNDGGLTWSSITTFGSAMTTGWNADSGWTTPNAGYAEIEFGLAVNNDSAAATNEYLFVDLAVVELKPA